MFILPSSDLTSNIGGVYGKDYRIYGMVLLQVKVLIQVTL